MNTDFIPQQDATLSVWCGNYYKQIEVLGPKLGMKPEEIAAEQALCKAMMDAIDLAAQKRQESAAAVKAKEMAYETQIGELRFLIGNHKRRSTITEEDQKQLGIAPINIAFDAAN